MALARQRVTFDGEFFTLPLPDGPGKALTLTVHPVREHIPLYLAAIGPKNLELAGEIADGWLAIFFSPEQAADSMAHIAAGRERAGLTLDGFDVVPSVPVAFGDDIEQCANTIRPYASLYIGGMGSKEMNFYNQLASRMGFEAEADDIQAKYMSKDYRGAAGAVPLGFIDQTSLIGPRERVRDRLAAYAEAGVTTLTITPSAQSLDERLAALVTMSEILDESGLAT
jgi:alkanesulfonate monooxygenase SsuD/methylene tetrahydromethanopterin reductase-like flavin-dependent oxidoreductase (luciferase family)